MVVPGSRVAVSKHGQMQQLFTGLDLDGETLGAPRPHLARRAGPGLGGRLPRKARSKAPGRLVQAGVAAHEHPSALPIPLNQFHFIEGSRCQFFFLSTEDAPNLKAG